jgi:hypothetical protein
MSRQLSFILTLLFLCLLTAPVPGQAAERSSTAARVTWHSHHARHEHRRPPARFDRGRRERWAGHDHEGFEHRRLRGYEGRRGLGRRYPAERRVAVAPLPVPIPRILLPPPPLVIIGGFRLW